MIYLLYTSFILLCDSLVKIGFTYQEPSQVATIITAVYGYDFKSHIFFTNKNAHVRHKYKSKQDHFKT